MRAEREHDAQFAAAFQLPGSELRQTPVLATTSRLSPRRKSDGLHRLNAALTVLVAALLVLSPLPVGSNRPPLWMAWGLYVGIITFAYAVTLLRLSASPRVPVGAIWPEFVLWAGLVAYICLQIVPLGNILPLGLIETPFASFSLQRLSLDPGQSTMVLIQFATFGLLYFLVLQLAVNRRRTRRLLYGLFAIIVASAVLGLASLTLLGDTLLGFEKNLYLGYATGTFINRNSFATYLATGLVLGTAMLLQVVAEREDLSPGTLIGRIGMLGVGIALIAGALLATGSRMGTVSALLGAIMTVGFGIFAYRPVMRRRVVVATAVAACLAIALVASFYGESLLHRLIYTSVENDQRLDVYPVIWSAILQRPFLGYGAGSFAAVFQAFQAPPVPPEVYFVNSHSTYLALWFETGLIFGSFPIAILAIATVKTLSALRESSSTLPSLATIGAVTVFAAHSLFDFPAEIEANSFLLVTMVALGAAGARKTQKSSDVTPTRGATGR